MSDQNWPDLRQVSAAVAYSQRTSRPANGVLLAKERKLSADPVTLQERLKDDVQLLCPLFQRKYVWANKEIDQLWADIDTILDGTADRRFLGALVFADVENSSSTSAGKYLVIDGQQRMTTLVLSVIALAERVKSQGREGREIATDLVQQYIVSRKSNTKNRPKLSPTLIDSHQFNEILRLALSDEFELDIDGDKEVGPATGTMTRAYALLRKHVENRTQPDADAQDTPAAVRDAVLRLMETVLDKLEFVEILLGDEHDPNEVFDRLNKEGVRLGIGDLVRNEVLKRLGDEPKHALKLHTQEWLPFERAFGDDPAALDEYFYPYSLTVDNKVTKAKVFTMLSTRWNAQFKDADTPPEEQLKKIMEGLKAHVVSYNAIARGEITQLDTDVAVAVEKLNSLNRPSSIYPYVMQLLTAHSNGEVEAPQAAQCLHIIESFLVRRALRGIEPTGLHAIFKGMWETAGADAGEVRRAIISKTVNFPTDEEVQEAIVGWPMYSRKILPYAMAEYERDVSIVDVMKHLPEITVDHLMPRSRKGDWQYVVSDEDFKRLVDTWGNLVPLSGPANSAKNAKSWGEARQLLQAETVFSTTKQVYMSHDEWDARAILARSRSIASWAIGRWPYFGDLLDDGFGHRALTH